MKKCSKCGIPKPYSQFYKDPRTKKDGLYGHCKKCHNLFSVGWMKKHPTRVRELSSKWQKQNSEKVSAKLKRYRLDPTNRVKTRGWNKNYKSRNKEKINAINAARRASQFKATPTWLTAEMKRDIEFFYSIRSSMAKPSYWNVDHYYPLQGEESTGLHVPWNLRLFPAKKNVAKSNTLPEPLPV